MPNRPISRTNVPKFRGRVSRQNPTTSINSPSVGGGIVTNIHPTNIQNEEFQDQVNFRVDYDQVTYRGGLVPVGATTSIDPAQITRIISWRRAAGNTSFICITANNAYWTSDFILYTLLTPTPSLVGVLNLYPSYTIAADRAFIATGYDVIREALLGPNTLNPLGNAPRYRYIFSFFNRILGCYLYDPIAVDIRPTRIGWSGDLNFSEWNPNVDFTAGFVDLIETPADTADEIRGGFGFANIALILRERSLWAITRQPSGTNPFAFSCINPLIGCDLPGTATQILNGIVWADNGSQNVYVYQVGTDKPEKIGTPINNLLFHDIAISSRVTSTYNVNEEVYSIIINFATTSQCRVYSYSFKTNKWWREEFYEISTINDGSVTSNNLTIDDLIGTIDQINGTIDSLVSATTLGRRLYADSTRRIILVENPDVTTDYRFTGTNSTRNIDRILYSKRYEQTQNDFLFTRFRLTLRLEIVNTTSNLIIEFSKDGGVTWTTYKTIPASMLPVGQDYLITCSKTVRCKTFEWRLRSSDGIPLTVSDYEIIGSSSGFSKAGVK